MMLFSSSLYRFFALVFIIVLFIDRSAAQSIYIYADDGTDGECIEQTTASLENELSREYRITQIMASQVINGSWRDDAALFVIPGGRATPYAESLNGKGNDKIRQYVEGGGAFLGICAGSYYGGAFVEFGKGAPYQVMREHELAFFRGRVIGPAFAAYEYSIRSSARPVNINWRDPDFPREISSSTIYYDGGGYFADAGSYPEVRVLATYTELPTNPPAIIHVRVKEGVAILSGVHFEFSTGVLSRKIMMDIPADVEKMRVRLLQNVLTHLGLKLREPVEE